MWMRISNDIYELPEVVAESEAALCYKLGLKPGRVLSCISHAEERGSKCRYVKVEMDEE